ncbi:MAG TPA: hypothetical protein VEA78_05540 [Acidimicrobiales bacterium]|nr:hypothetical protein [Acidimicrobiales bacterium]
MRYFLLAYDQKAGRLVSQEEFPEAELERAQDRRFELEQQHRGTPGMEVVMLGAESIEQVKRTHRRYFMTVKEMLEAI